MNHKERLSLTCRHELEVQQIIDLANCVGMYHNKGRTPDVIAEDEFFYEISDANINHHPSVVPLSKFVSALLTEGEDNEGVLEYLTNHSKGHELMGVYLQVAVPVKKGSTFSWGHYRLAWIYGDTYEEAFKAACEWAKEQGHNYD